MGKTGRRKKEKIFSVLMFLFFVILAILILIPIWAIFIGSFKDGTELLRNGLNLKLEFEKMNLDNWKMLFTESGCLLYTSRCV